MSYDTDAQSYITAVEAADGQVLPYTIKDAINNFVVGCKSDSIWTAIKSACFLAGPATLAGALVPLTGSAPTNVNFVPVDYSQFTGLIGNATNKYLNSNRAANADPQNNSHQAVWVTTNSGAGVWVGALTLGTGIGTTLIVSTAAVNWPFRSRIAVYDSASQGTRSTATATGFVGLTRSLSGSCFSRVSGSTETITCLSTTSPTETFGVFARRRTDTGLADAYTASRLAWYSVGESLNLALLDARLTTYMSEITKPIISRRRRQQGAYGL